MSLGEEALWPRFYVSFQWAGWQAWKEMVGLNERGAGKLYEG